MSVVQPVLDKRQREAADRHSENMDRVFPVLVHLALDGLPLPDAGPLGKLAGMRPSTALEAVRDLAHAGRIGIEYPGAKARRIIVIRDGEHAGKRTATTAQALRAVVAKARAASDAQRSPRRNGSAGQPCAWCEKPLPKNATEHGSYCSMGCVKQHSRHGFGANARQVAARREHLKAQPKGCATVEEFLRAGGVVYREDYVRHA